MQVDNAPYKRVLVRERCTVLVEVQYQGSDILGL